MNRPYSEATVELVGRTSYLAGWHYATEADWETLPVNERNGYRKQARAVLTALAAAGLLLPEGAETRTEWTAQLWGYDGQWRMGGVGDEDYARLVVESVDTQVGSLNEATRRANGVERVVLASRVVRTYPDGSRHIGPWEPVDAVGLAVGDSKPTQDHEVSGV